MTASIIERSEACLFGNYARYPVAFTHGEGRRLFGEDGKTYLDMFSGLGVSCLGHGHPGVVAAVREQAGKLLHTSNLYYHEPAARLGSMLCERSFADRVFFCNSGTEAVEAVIKLARRARSGRTKIVATHGSFHGRTLGALAATGQPSLQEGFGPMPGGFEHVPYGDIDATTAAVDENTAAVLVEPIQGEGGVVVPADGYLKALRKACDEAGALLALDEVQTGVGRTGFLYAHEYDGVRPDIVASAKGLAAGLPIGAVLAGKEVAAALVPGSHGTTFGANPVSCAAGAAVLGAFDEEGILANCLASGSRLRKGLEAIAARLGAGAEVRGRGLMLGLQLPTPAKGPVARALELGLIANATAGNVVRLLPPLNITADEVDEGLAILGEALA